MPIVTTTASFEHEEYGKGEYSTFSRQVEDLDIQDYLWFLMKQTEMMGFSCKQIQLITEDDKMFSTDL